MIWEQPVRDLKRSNYLLTSGTCKKKTPKKQKKPINIQCNWVSSPCICLTRCGWGLWREKNEWWLREPNRGLLDGSFWVNSALNVKWLVKPRLLSPVGPRDSGLCATDISWNDMFLFEEEIKETFLQVLSICIPVLAEIKLQQKPWNMQENTKLHSFREPEDNFLDQPYYFGFCVIIFRHKESQRTTYLCKIASSWKKAKPLHSLHTVLPLLLRNWN